MKFQNTYPVSADFSKLKQLVIIIFLIIIITEFRRKLKCINSSSLRRARRCVKTLTLPLRQTLTALYMQNKTDSYDARRLACM